MSKYRVWWIPQIPGTPFFVAVPDLATGRLVSDVLAQYDLFQYENNIKGDYANAGGVQVWDAEENDWTDIEDDE